MASEFQRVERPPASFGRAASSVSRARAIRDTLTTGDAIAVPINGDSAKAVRSRVGCEAYRAACRLNARGRTRLSDDGLFILVWLEPK